jgi:hypothetical protein
MDTQTIDQEFEKLQTEFQDVASTVKSLAAKMQAAETAGDSNATGWLDDLEQVAKDIDDEQAQAQALLVAIHGFVTSLAQAQPAAQAESEEHPPLFAPGHSPQDQDDDQQAQAPQRHGILDGMFGGGMMGGGMMGGYGGSGFARSMEMGMGMSLGANLLSSIFR